VDVNCAEREEFLAIGIKHSLVDRLVAFRETTPFESLHTALDWLRSQEGWTDQEPQEFDLRGTLCCGDA